jgi:hypothetical protein
VPFSHSECSAGNWLTRNNVCTVQYRSECIYILQINFIKKKKRQPSDFGRSAGNDSIMKIVIMNFAVPSIISVTHSEI